MLDNSHISVISYKVHSNPDVKIILCYRSRNQSSEGINNFLTQQCQSNISKTGSSDYKALSPSKSYCPFRDLNIILIFHVLNGLVKSPRLGIIIMTI